jgi:hypothetical protein
VVFDSSRLNYESLLDCCYFFGLFYATH